MAGDPVIPDFGDLNDLTIPCELVFDKYYAPETSSDGDYSEERRKILFFDKRIALEALSKIEPDRTVSAKGPGRAIFFLERSGYGYNRYENTVEEDIDAEVEVTLEITYLKDERQVVFNFDSRPIHPEDKLRLTRSIRLSGYGILSSNIQARFIALE